MLKKVYFASAGTGKTHTIVSEAFEFIKDDFEKLKKIVFITFSNAGAEEIRERIYEKLKDKLKDPSQTFFLSDKIRVYTVHSFCRELCRIFRYELNFSYDMRFPVSEDVTIWDETVEEFFQTRWNYSKLGDLFEEKEKDIFDAFYYLSDKNAIKGFIKKYGFALFFLIRFGLVKAEAEKKDLKINLEDLVIAKEKIKYALQSDEKEEISEQVKNMSDIISALSEAKFVVYKIIKEIGNIYINSIYEKSRLDFDALLFFAAKIMNEKKIEGVLKRLEEEGEDFECLFVDEAQDCDMAMNYFLSFFMGEGEKDPKLSLVMVGDAKQSVYRWRNAYPEEFLKICKEAKKSSKLETMKISYRIKNKNTLDFLNSVMDKMKSEVYKDFFDYGEDDILDLEKSNKEDRKIDVLYALMEDKNKILSLKDIEDFIKNKRVGILFRSRNNLKKSNLEKILGEKIIYKLSEPIETESLFDSRSKFDEDEISDILPDYSLLKNLFNLFGYDNSDKISALLVTLLTEKGLEAALKISPDISQSENAKDFIKKAKSFCETVSELNSKYEGNYISEKLARFLEEKKLWEVFFRKESYLEPEQTVRYLNRVTVNFYLKEKKQEFRSKEFISEILKTSKTPYETAVTYDNESKLNDFIEATTVHSAKGLTYDKVIFIANFNEMLDTNPDIFKNKEEFSYLFSVSFDRVTMPEQKISVEFFPYLGLDTA
ncbi:MAG: UvrD-helicase domain-containing protein, partial [Elusimicrobiales bacterium]|nr:UvrD-helicase domain-containing protein [Elusimicrobiales bacterium]